MQVTHQMRQKPGWVYMHNGRRWLCLNNVRFTVNRARIEKDDTRTIYPAGLVVHGQDTPYQYLLWSRTLDEVMDGHKDLNHLVRYLSSTDKNRPWTTTSRFSARTEPMPCEKELGQILDLNETKPEIIESSPVTFKSLLIKDLEEQVVTLYELFEPAKTAQT